MTPKQKAKDIVKRMYEHQWRDDNVEYRNAKNSAIVCVNEVLKVAKFYDEHSDQINYWKQVKTEIKKL